MAFLAQRERQRDSHSKSHRQAAGHNRQNDTKQENLFNPEDSWQKDKHEKGSAAAAMSVHHESEQKERWRPAAVGYDDIISKPQRCCHDESEADVRRLANSNVQGLGYRVLGHTAYKTQTRLPQLNTCQPPPNPTHTRTQLPSSHPSGSTPQQHPTCSETFYQPHISKQ